MTVILDEAPPTPWRVARPADPDHLLNVVGALPPMPRAGDGDAPGQLQPTGPALSGHADPLFAAGLEAHNRGDAATAERCYRQALAVDPTHYQSTRYYAKILAKRSDFAAVRRRLFAAFVHRAAGDRVVWDLMASASAALGVPLPLSVAPVSLTGGRVVRREHFRPVADVAAARALFRASVTNLDLELFSYCNRRCLYCPNAFIDRITANHYLAGGIYRMVVRDLAAIDYAGKVTLNFYNEPLADPVTVRACAEIRRLVPRAFLRLNTNGDYLREDTFDELHAAGLNHVIISLHVSKTLAWDDEKVRFRAEQIYERTGRRPSQIKFVPGRHYRATIPFEGMRVEVVQGNYNEFGYNIGGLMKHIPAPAERRSPCMEPFGSMTVTYNGELTACCRIRGDADEHRPYRCGNLADYGTIYQAWANASLAAWRRHLVGFNAKAAPCNSCVAVSVPRSPEAEAAHRAATCHVDPDQREPW